MLSTFKAPVDLTPFYVLVTAIVIVIAAVAVILVWRKKVKVKS
jgi:multisubunit Na+/H+ antiporter MnhC subunit